MKLIIRPIKWTIIPDGGSLFDESATEIEIVDEAAGEFVEISQSMEGYGKIGIEPSDWPTLRAAIDAAVKQCKEAKL